MTESYPGGSSRQMRPEDMYDRLKEALSKYLLYHRIYLYHSFHKIELAE